MTSKSKATASAAADNHFKKLIALDEAEVKQNKILSDVLGVTIHDNHKEAASNNGLFTGSGCSSPNSSDYPGGLTVDGDDEKNVEKNKNECKNDKNDAQMTSNTMFDIVKDDNTDEFVLKPDLDQFPGLIKIISENNVEQKNKNIDTNDSELTTSSLPVNNPSTQPSLPFELSPSPHHDLTNHIKYEHNDPFNLISPEQTNLKFSLFSLQKSTKNETLNNPNYTSLPRSFLPISTMYTQPTEPRNFAHLNNRDRRNLDIISGKISGGKNNFQILGEKNVDKSNNKNKNNKNKKIGTFFSELFQIDKNNNTSRSNNNNNNNNNNTTPSSQPKRPYAMVRIRSDKNIGLLMIVFSVLDQYKLNQIEKEIAYRNYVELVFYTKEYFREKYKELEKNYLLGEKTQDATTHDATTQNEQNDSNGDEYEEKNNLSGPKILPQELKKYIFDQEKYDTKMTDFMEELISFSLPWDLHHYPPSIPTPNKSTQRIVKGKLVRSKDEVLETYDGEKWIDFDSWRYYLQDFPLDEDDFAAVLELWIKEHEKEQQ
jgi:hypothetical protein